MELAALRAGRPAEAARQGRRLRRALLVAKLHKLGDRLATPARLKARDAGDVYRLFDAVGVDDMAATVETLLADNRSAGTTTKALTYRDALFTTPRALASAWQGALRRFSLKTRDRGPAAFAAALRRTVTDG